MRSIHSAPVSRSPTASMACNLAVQRKNLGAGFAKAVNDWMAAEWLDKEPRLRASIVVPAQNPRDWPVDEINRVAATKRFVQVLLLVHGRHAVGQTSLLAHLRRGRETRPADRHPRRQRVPASCHVVGVADLITPRTTRAQAPAFQQALSSLICEGVVYEISGFESRAAGIWFHLVAAHLWRLTKFWRGLRIEVPWARSCTNRGGEIERSPDDPNLATARPRRRCSRN